jgi:hypothetical protein
MPRMPRRRTMLTAIVLALVLVLGAATAAYAATYEDWAWSNGAQEDLVVHTSGTLVVRTVATVYLSPFYAGVCASMWIYRDGQPFLSPKRVCDTDRNAALRVIWEDDRRVPCGDLSLYSTDPQTRYYSSHAVVIIPCRSG